MPRGDAISSAISRGAPYGGPPPAAHSLPSPARPRRGAATRPSARRYSARRIPRGQWPGAAGHFQPGAPARAGRRGKSTGGQLHVRVSSSAISAAANPVLTHSRTLQLVGGRQFNVRVSRRAAVYTTADRRRPAQPTRPEIPLPTSHAATKSPDARALHPAAAQHEHYAPAAGQHDVIRHIRRQPPGGKRGISAVTITVGFAAPPLAV